MNWGTGVLQTSALLLLVFCAIDCVAARSSDTRVPVSTLRSSSLTRLVTDAKFCAGKDDVVRQMRGTERLFQVIYDIAKKITRYIKYLVFFWRRHPDLNWGIKVLQTSALPLGYVAELARVAGFEPAHDGIRIRCLTAWRYPKI